jgi:hypothetical protein
MKMRTMSSYIALIIVAMLATGTAWAAGDPKSSFDAFMKMAQSGDLKKAIKERGIDERSDKSFLNIKVPGKLNYEIKDVDQKKSGEEATISAVIDYEPITEGAKDAAGKVATAGKAASGNIVGAAGSMAKNTVGGSVSSVRDKEKVKMKRVGGEWMVVVTDKLFDVLTGKGK